MKEIILHLIDRVFDDIDSCIVGVLAVGVFVIFPILLVIASMIK